jgi:DNA-binding NarL/FixJ family response regulator
MARELTAKQAELIEAAALAYEAAHRAQEEYLAAVVAASVAGATNTAIAARLGTSAENVRKIVARRTGD